MTSASIVSTRRFRPSVDQSRDVGDPISVTTVKAEQVEAARRMVATKAASDADRVRLLNVLGLDDVTASGEKFTPEMRPGSLAALDALYALGVKP